MTERKQFVSIDSFNSDALESPICSVIQGSKLSAVLYTLYINEITKLHNLMNDNIFNQMTGEHCLGKDLLKTIDHIVVQ